MEKEEKREKKHDYARLDNTTLRWYVMLSGNPRLLEIQLQRENARRYEHQEEELPMLEYFIPYCFLTRQTEREESRLAADIEYANSLREDFHDFAFIHATRRQIALLGDSDWNRTMRSRLCHYRDRQWREVTITEEEKDNLIAVFSEQRIRFSIGLPVADIGPDVKVQVRRKGSFEGQTARIIEVKHTADGISLKLGIPVFNGMKELTLQDFTLEDIQAEGVTEDIIGELFIRETEKTLTGILERRVKHKETDETRRQDATELNHTFLYSYVSISDRNLSAHFRALMLLCATLRFDRESVKALTESVREQMGSSAKTKAKYSPEVLAVMNFSLYIATRDADYRTAGKECVRQHPECTTDTLRRLMSLSGLLRSKRKRN